MINNIHKQQQITSHIAPWLINLVYPLGAFLVIPFYFGKINISGQENIPSSGAVIVAPTHRSRWDALLVPYATGRLVSGRDLYFMVSANEMKGIQGCLVRRLGGFPVNTSHPGLGTFRHSFELLCRGEMVVIFPEGGIVRSSKIQALKEGVARIALEVASTQANSPIKILPLSIKYHQPIPGRGCDVQIKIGSCLNVLEYHRNSLKKDTVTLTQDLENSLKQLHEN
jgi:1-acyl-sn-glycerol-3-phosphate acyltransferase